MTRADITQDQARLMAIHAQHLDRRPTKSGKPGAGEIIEQLGYVQIDPLSVIERAHHHTLWTRLPDYEPAVLDEMHAGDRSLFEYWGHAQSYLPISDFRFHLPRMQQFAASQNPWIRHMTARGGDWQDRVLAHVRGSGPATASEIAGAIGDGGNGSSRGEAIRAALELLTGRGELMVSERRHFQKVYDLAERVLPPQTDTRTPEVPEVARFYVRRALRAFGIAREREIHCFMQPESSRDNHYQACSRSHLSQALADLAHASEVKRLRIDGLDDDYYALAQSLAGPALRAEDGQVHLLSPFDNLIIQRDRLRLLFDFEYTLECYRPPAQRRYGYFVLPVLWGQILPGRVDLKADRKNKRLLVQNLVFEPSFGDHAALLPPLGQKLTALARFNHCDDIALERVNPAKWRTPLLRTLQAAQG